MDVFYLEGNFINKNIEMEISLITT